MHFHNITNDNSKNKISTVSYTFPVNTNICTMSITWLIELSMCMPRDHWNWHRNTWQNGVNKAVKGCKKVDK